MFEIFGSEEVTRNTNAKFTAVVGPLKGEISKKRSISLGSSKKALCDVSNKVKNTLQLDPTSYLRTISPCKSSKKSLFSENRLSPEVQPKNVCITQSTKLSKSPVNRIPLSPISDKTIAKRTVQSMKRSKSPKNITSISAKPNGIAKIPIFVESDSENEMDSEKNLMDQLDDVFASPSADGNEASNFSDFREPVQAIYGCCPGYETPDEDSDGWLIEPLWNNNKKELENIINIHQSQESVRELSDIEELPVEGDILVENIFGHDTFIIPEPCDVPIPDMEW